MKSLIKTLGSMILCAIGWLFGGWLWNSVLKEKCENIKDRLKKK